MTGTLIFALVWAASSAAAFVVFVDDWRSSFDANRGDVTLFAILSVLGPISLASALIVWLVGKSTGRESPVIWERKR